MSRPGTEVATSAKTATNTWIRSIPAKVLIMTSTAKVLPDEPTFWGLNDLRSRYPRRKSVQLKSGSDEYRKGSLTDWAF